MKTSIYVSTSTGQSYMCIRIYWVLSINLWDLASDKVINKNQIKTLKINISVGQNKQQKMPKTYVCTHPSMSVHHVCVRNLHDAAASRMRLWFNGFANVVNTHAHTRDGHLRVFGWSVLVLPIVAGYACAQNVEIVCTRIRAYRTGLRTSNIY